MSNLFALFGLALFAGFFNDHGYYLAGGFVDLVMLFYVAALGLNVIATIRDWRRARRQYAKQS